LEIGNNLLLEKNFIENLIKSAFYFLYEIQNERFIKSSKSISQDEWSGNEFKARLSID